MKNLTSKPRWTGLCALVLVFTALCGRPAFCAAGAAKAPENGRADLVNIKPVVAKPEMTRSDIGVVFLHDKHTMALGAEGKDCATCHAPAEDAGKKGALTFVLKGTEGKTGTDLKNAFHEKCIGCHTETGRAGKPTGPAEAACRSCHSARPDVANAWNDIGFDKRIHNTHLASAAIPPVGDPEKNCAACHHIYDPATKQRVWGKDKEDSCRACHMMPEERDALLKKNPEAADENGLLKDRKDFRKAGHEACVNCHLQVLAAKKPGQHVGPTDCAGCHSAATQAKLFAASADAESMQKIPRLMRGQPDAALMLAVPEQKAEGDKTALKGSMKPVAFNHQFHESRTADCRSCHHKKIAACSSCHTLEGSDKSNGVGLAQAMHSVKSERSCAGCHVVEKEKPSCAGCHTYLPKGTPPESCGGCHTAPVGVTAEQAEDGSLLTLSKNMQTDLAKLTVTARERTTAGAFAQTEIPDQVTIGTLSKEYEPATLPHRKIVKTLTDRQTENRLAAAFHSDKTSLCRGCHHNSPASKTPPKCVSCHSIDGQSAATGRPALKAAYHQQCMNCHAAMQQKPAATDCTEGCHKPRGNQ